MKCAIEGKRFGRLTVLRENGRDNHKNVLWECFCDCGKTVTIRTTHLTLGRTKSCGCLQSEMVKEANETHGQSRSSSTYRVWAGIIQRCTNPKNKSYPYYGGRGITVCEHWRSFENFFSDMGDRPDGLSIDRLDNDQGYSPGNCEWKAKTQNKQGISVQGQQASLALRA